MSSILVPDNGLIAAGSSQATALLLSAIKQIHQVSTVAALSGVRIPQTTPGLPFWILNQGLNVLSVYPPTSGAINSLGTNIAYSLYPGASGMFISGDGLSFQAYSVSGVSG